MIGNNEIAFNGATIVQMVQHYFDTVMFKEGQAPAVSSFFQRQTDFIVKVAPKEVKK